MSDLPVGRIVDLPFPQPGTPVEDLPKLVVDFIPPVSSLSGLTPGRMVHYVLEHGVNANQHRPAVVVRVMMGADGLPTGVVNLQVFTDGAERGGNDQLPQILWATSVLYSENLDRGTWHWIERA